MRMLNLNASESEGSRSSRFCMRVVSVRIATYIHKPGGH